MGDGTGVRTGPLAGLRVIELAGIGPGPFCAMMLADAGADVLRIDRPDPSGLGLDLPPRFDVCGRSRRSVALDLKHPDAIACLLDLLAGADALIEGFRPGTTERLGLGPDRCLAANPRLVYGRVTGWGQEGPLAGAAGHDLDYIALSGALHAIGPAGGAPVPPLNLVGDYGGGGMLLAFGMAAALAHAARTGTGQVVDAAMVDGASTLMAMFHGLRAAGLHGEARGTNLLDGGAPHYATYACRDGLRIAVAPIEAKFRRVLAERLGLPPESFDEWADPATWPEASTRLATIFAGRDRAAWCELLEGTDACVAPVLTMAEAAGHPHALARAAFAEVGGIVQPAPAPRFSATPSSPPTPTEAPGASTRAALLDWDIPQARIDALLAVGAAGARQPA